MEHKSTWAKSFNLSDDQVSNWAKNLPSGRTLVRWVLENGKVPAEMFTIWAKKHYQLPVLKESFADFKTAAIIRKRYEGVWPDHVSPVGEWKGTLFLACLEPDENFKSPQTVQWVLAPLSMILKLRDEASLAVDLPNEPTLNDMAPAGLKIDLPPVPVSFNDMATMTREVQVDAPAGLNLSAPVPPSLEAPVGLSLVPPIPAASLPPLPNVEAAPRMTPPPPPMVPPKVGTIAESGIRSFEDVGYFLITEMNKSFTHSMVLLFKNNKLEPWIWSDSWTNDPNRGRAIDLSTPSIFRIVNESKSPFHGAIVPNVVNDAFFQTWSKGQYPAHITIQPIIMGKTIGGMLLGTCASLEAGKGISLIQCERLSDKAAELLVKWRSSAKAA